MATAAEKLTLAKKHLRKVEAAWDPPDWADLSFYGFYCLEAAVDAAGIHLGLQVQSQHWSRVQAAEILTSRNGLPEVAELLRSLNEVRKSEAYGDVEAPDLDAEDVVSSIQSYVEAVTTLIGAG
jgi:hypothetical protein